jgi:deoxyribodipyrimidine photolyase
MKFNLIKIIKKEGYFMVQYYSDITKQFYNTEESCIAAETKYNLELKAKEEEKLRVEKEKAALAAAIEAAKKEYLDFNNETVKARKKYESLISDYCKEYGTYRSVTTKPYTYSSLSDYIRELMNSDI